MLSNGQESYTKQSEAALPIPHQYLRGVSRLQERFAEKRMAMLFGAAATAAVIAYRCRRRKTIANQTDKASCSKRQVRGIRFDLPDYEPKFINDALKMLWPHISAYFTEVLATSVQPAVQAALPAAIGCQLGFDKQNCHLGHEPFSIRAIRASRTFQSTYQGEAENLSVRADFQWEGDCSIYLKCAGAGIGIGSFSVKGELNIDAVWLCNEPPMFRGTRAFFLNPPDVSFEWQGAAKMDMLGLLKRTILSALSDQISRRLVLPNMLGYACHPQADIFYIRNPQPEGHLQVTVHSAENLPAADHDMLGRLTTSDPYFELQCGAQVVRSETQFKTLSPTYDHAVMLFITSAAQQAIRLSFYDQDFVKSADFLGTLDVAVSDVISWGRRKQVLFLTGSAGETGSYGRVWISAEWRPLLASSSPRASDGACFVFAGLYTACGVPVLGQGAEHWVEAECTELSPLSPKPAKQETSRVADQGASREQLDVETKRMKEKFKLMSSYGMSADEIARVLEVNSTKLLQVMRPQQLPPGDWELGCPTSGTQRLTFEHAFEFVVTDPLKAVMTFIPIYHDATKRSSGQSAAPPSGMEACSFPIAELMAAPNNALKKTLKTASGVHLEFLFQLGFFTAPTDEMWFDAED